MIGPTIVMLISALAEAVPGFAKAIALIGGTDEATVEDRIARAKAAVKAPIDVGHDDAARRERLERALRGER